MGYDLKSIRQEFRKNGVFYTQKSLALYMRGLLPDDVKEIYDPTCGNGGLLSVFGDDVHKYGQDINADQVAEAKQRLKNFHGVVGDTLKAPAFLDRKFKHIIANPPFSIKWEHSADERFDELPCLPPASKADYAFIAHILHYLTDDGTAVVLNSAGILYRGNAEGKIRRWIVEKNYIDAVIAIDNGHFVDTNVATVILVLRKNRITTDITFVHNDKSRIVSLAEIDRNNYQMDVRRYIQEAANVDDTDLADIEMDGRKQILDALENWIRLEKMLCAVGTKWDGSLIDELKAIIRRYDSPGGGVT